MNPSWQPNIWPKICPYPFCPTYRQFSRFLAFSLIGKFVIFKFTFFKKTHFLGVFAWCVVYTIVGDIAAPPNGILYQLILLAIVAHFGGWLISLLTLPPLVGMLFTGVLVQNTGIVDINHNFSGINKVLRYVYRVSN